ncbi:iron complex outermembrane receptor protein [Chitinophaga niastensis]|uniref:Iron complex outermembrane receptor protein n=1 Tax=Chitinophaga niastensis TaxID=536980 RepID=A0A2P8HC44_CHINA|nr:TonB-dependent receptor [Chitinophaga niastensis]PSL43815.1 iron complex outermembrane receptor protein [Chitinophaga niastensis]
MKKQTGFGLIITILLFIPSIIFATDENTGTIKGKVLTTDGKSATDVVVLLKETNETVITETDGSFVFDQLKPGNYHLEVTLMGYKTVVEQVLVVASKTNTIKLKLDVSSKALKEVVVTGNHNKLIRTSSYDVAKMPLKNLENPQVYSTITKDLLQQQLVFSVDDAMKNAPGITKMWDATGRVGDGGSYFNSRGFIVQSQLRNGIAGNVSAQIDAANLERVEVIKGPSATLFGSTLTSYGGLINRVTKKPYDHFGGEMAYAIGSYGFNRVSADVNTPLDKNNDVLLRINTAYDYEGSFQDYGFHKGFAFAPSLSYRVNDRLSFLFDAEYFSGQNTGLNVFFFPYMQPIADLGANRADQLKIDYKRHYAGNDLFQVGRSTNLFGQMNYKLSDQWNMNTNITSTNSFSNGPSPYAYLLSDAAATGVAGAVGSNYISRNDQFTDNATDRVIEIQHNFNGDFKIGSLRNRFTGGLDFFHHNSNQIFAGGVFDTIPSHGVISGYANFNRRNLDKVYDKYGIGSPYVNRFISNTYSAYASDVLNITDNLMVLAALRIDYFDNKGAYVDSLGAYTGGYNQTAFSPKLGIVYQLIKDKISIFGNYQNGFKNQPGVSAANKTFKPEQANQLEGGVKLYLLDGKITSTVSYYSIKVKDILRPDLEHVNFSIQNGTQISKGFEAEVIANPVQGLNIVAGYAYNDSKYEASAKDVEGLRPATAGAPASANLWISYRISTGAVRGLGFGFGGNYASDNKVVNDKTIGTFILPAYTVLNGSIFYDHARFRVGVKMDNITDKHYWIGYTTVNPQKLRSFTGSMAFKF